MSKPKKKTYFIFISTQIKYFDEFKLKTNNKSYKNVKIDWHTMSVRR